MSDRLSAVVKAMILVSLSACALLAACGGTSGSDGPDRVPANQLLTRVSAELSEAQIVILDDDPKEESVLSLSDVAEVLEEHGAVAKRGALVRMDAYTDVQNLAPETYPEVLAWALEMDLTSYDGDGIFAPESSMAIVFVGATDGSFVSMYER